MEDKKLKKKLSKIPDADKNGEPIFKIADVKSSGKKPNSDARRAKNQASK